MTPAFECRFFDLDRLAVDPAWRTPEEEARVARKATPTLRQRQAASFHAVRATLGEVLGLPPQTVPITVEPGGKPVISDGRLHFNMSHSDGVGLLAWSHVPVGADVEAVIARPRDALAREILDETEWSMWTVVPEAQRPAWLTRAWTRKEAALKAAGTGLRVPPREVHVAGGAGEGDRRTIVVASRRWTCIDLEAAVPEGYRAAVCIAASVG